MLHKHIWEEQKRTFAPSRLQGEIEVKGGGGFGGAKPSDFHKILFGVTTIEYKCTKCPKMKFVEVKGDAR